MQDELINIDKLKDIFGYSTGERTIEVTEEEYQNLYEEAEEKGLTVDKQEDSFSLKMGELTIKIVCDYDEDDLEEDD